LAPHSYQPFVEFKTRTTSSMTGTSTRMPTTASERKPQGFVGCCPLSLENPLRAAWKRAEFQPPERADVSLFIALVSCGIQA
jgi:hypothetical protein